jgi:hypothetical protein
MRHLFIWSALLIGLLATLAAVPGRAADPVDNEAIEKLVKQLTSGRFAEREKAQKKLEEIGRPAIPALKKATETGDPETKRRASDLIAKFEKEAQGAKILAPTKVTLSYKDTPLKDALADFSKKTGYNLSLLDPENKLKDRKVTLEVAETSFWQAFDQFCAKAGLVEAEANEAQQFLPGGPVNGPFPGIQIQPAPIKRINIVPPQPANPPIRKAVPLPAEKLEKAGALQVQVEDKAQAAKAQAEAEAARARAREEAVKAEEAKAQAIKAQVAAQQAAAQKAQAQQIQIARPIRRPFPPQPIQPQQNQILLKDGKAATVPTDYSGAVRIKQMDNTAMFGPTGEKELLLGLKVSPEPKIQWQQLVNVRIDKAIDDQDQKLMQVMGQANPGQVNPFGNIGGGFGGFQGGWAVQGFPIGAGGIHQKVPVRLSKGEKASKSLKELTGSLTAEVLTPAEVHISVDNVAKSVGKTVKGKESGSIKVNGFDEQNGQIIIRAEIEQPKDVVPAGQNGIGGFGFGGGFGGPGIQIIPQILPVQPPAAPPALPGGAFQIQAAPAQVKAKAQVQIQVQQVQIGGVAVARPFFQVAGNGMGLELLDEKGNVIPLVGTGIAFQGGPGAAVQETHLTFQPKEGQKAAKLVFKGSKIATVEIPFSLKDAKLP